MSTLIDVKEAAQLLNLTPQQVRNLCRNGKLQGKKIGDIWLIEKDNILKYYDKSTCGVAENQTNYYTNKEIKAIKKPIALSFFSGAMGMDIGLELEGFEILLCSEIDNACRKTILKNKPNIALIGDIRNYSSAEILKNAGLKKGDEIDLIVGGPPCQAFSTAGKRKCFEDKRGNVFITFVETIIQLKPKYAVIENVRGILSAPLKHRPHSQRGINYPPLAIEEESGGALQFILSLLRSNGYGVTFNLYNAANFGTPQKRERVVLICSRDGDQLPYLEPTNSPNGEYNLPAWKTFKDAVAGLNENEQHYIKFPEKRLKYYRLLKPGQYWKNLPKELQKEALGASYYAGGGKTGFLRRLSWDEPSPTLVTNPAMPATDLAHPISNRPLSIEEYKRLQEFPDDWQIEGSLIEQYRQVGNAVPISLGRAIGRLLKKYMAGETIKQYNKFPYSRYRNTDDKSWDEMIEVRHKKRLLKLTS